MSFAFCQFDPDVSRWVTSKGCGKYGLLGCEFRSDSAIPKRISSLVLISSRVWVFSSRVMRLWIGSMACLKLMVSPCLN